MLSFLKKYHKDLLITISVVLVAFFFVMGGHFADIAKHSFWWNFWIVIQIASGIAVIGGWIYEYSAQNRK